MIFVGTGAWYASAVTNDVDHPAAETWLESNRELLLTTDYIVDETLTLLKARGYPAHAMKMGEMFFDDEFADIILITEDDIHLAWRTFKQYADKEWSFTDCTSKVVMERLGITQAFSFDHHFRQFGSITVVP